MKNRSVQINEKIINVLKAMDAFKTKILIVFEKNRFKGLITIGDIQRAIINNIDINAPILNILDTNKQYATPNDSIDKIKQKMLKLRAEIMPIVDQNNNLLKIYTWNDFFNTNVYTTQEIGLPIVIMAGGKGTRLSPLTNIYPKPLIPIGEKTIIETIMDKFVNYNCHDFFISVNYKADMIKNYFDFINNQDYKITYFQEEKPMGTAGSLRLLKDQIKSTFFVSNCDILVNEDYSSILNYHYQNKNELTVVAALKTYSIPYGTINTGTDGLLESIEEKPDLTFKINTGLYILEPSLLNDIPDDYFHITNLMEKLKVEGRRVGIYPISQNDWQDMGDWNEYLRMINVR